MEGLHLVSSAEMPSLLKWLEERLPHSLKLFGSVRENVLGRWKGLTFYTLGWPDIRAVGEGIPEEKCDIHDYMTHPRKTSVYAPRTEDARTLLTWPGFLDWSQPIIFQGVSTDIGELIATISKDHCDADDLPDIHKCYVMMAKPGEIVPRSSPGDVTVQRLDYARNAEFASANWPHRSHNSETYLAALLKNLPSVGVFDDKGECLGYECFTDYGTMGMLFVSKEARGRGIGSLITCNLAEQRFKDGHSAVVTVEVWNEPSVKLHERLGFKTVGEVSWVIHSRKSAVKQALVG